MCLSANRLSFSELFDNISLVLNAIMRGCGYSYQFRESV